MDAFGYTYVGALLGIHGLDMGSHRCMEYLIANLPMAFANLEAETRGCMRTKRDMGKWSYGRVSNLRGSSLTKENW